MTPRLRLATRPDGADGHRQMGNWTCPTPPGFLSLIVASSHRTLKLYMLYSGCCSMYGRMYGVQVCRMVELASEAPAGTFHLPGGNPPCESWCMCIARPNCLRLLVHLAREAASRTFWT